MAELVDAQVSGTCEGFLVKVQVFSRAPIKKSTPKECFFCRLTTKYESALRLFKFSKHRKLKLNPPKIKREKKLQGKQNFAVLYFVKCRQKVNDKKILCVNIKQNKFMHKSFVYEDII